MVELVMRGRHNDHLVLGELLAGPLPDRRLLRRVVVDAPAAAQSDGFERSALDTGTQYLIDPMTPLLTSAQDAGDSWARLPFADPAPTPEAQLGDPAWQQRIVESVVDFQLDHGATGVIPPYLHLRALTPQAVAVQEQLLVRTAQLLADEGLRIPVVPVLSVDRHRVPMDATGWEAGLGRMLRTAASLTDQPVGLALSSTTKHSLDGLLKAAHIWQRTAQICPFIAWHAGDIGPLAVTQGADGYETGLCGAERCNVSQASASRRPRKPDPEKDSSHPTFTGVYISALGISLALKPVRAMSQVRSLQADLGCHDPSCCPRGFDSMLGSGRRQHAARSRLSDLAALSAITARRWRLHHLETQAIDALAAANRIRRHADARRMAVGARPTEHEAMLRAVRGLRATSRTAVA